MENITKTNNALGIETCNPVNYSDRVLLHIVYLLLEIKAVFSASEAKRLIKQKAVKVSFDGYEEITISENPKSVYIISANANEFIIKIDKKKIYRITKKKESFR